MVTPWRVCAQAGCVALATQGDRCAVHAAGYQLKTDEELLYCANCRRQIKKDHYYQVRDGDVFHVKPCAMHPDVMAAKVDASRKMTR